MITSGRHIPGMLCIAPSPQDFPLEPCPELTRFQSNYLEILQNQFCKYLSSSELSAWEGTVQCFQKLNEAINRVSLDCQFI